MNWDDHNGPVHFLGTPINMDGPIVVGESVKLTKDGYEFNVSITSINDSTLTGCINTIGEKPILEACGLKRADNVKFRPNNILTLYRK